MAVYLNSFYPLCSTKAGRTAILKYDLPDYIDGSCRREPDFKNKFPVITGLCRPGFAQKLNVGDIVIYVTNKKGVGAKNVVSVLKVKEIFCNHNEAASFYQNKNYEVPNNLMVKQSKPFSLDKTHQKFGWDVWVKNTTLKEWDKQYLGRSRNPSSNKVVRCEKLFEDVKSPIELNSSDWEEISKRKLCAQNPPKLTQLEWDKFKLKINLYIND